MEPRDIDYTTMELGQALRLPKGRIVSCPACGKHGLLLVYAWRRGRYDVGIWHSAVKDHPGAPPLCGESCNFRGREKTDVRRVAALVDATLA